MWQSAKLRKKGLVHDLSFQYKFLVKHTNACAFSIWNVALMLESMRQNLSPMWLLVARTGRNCQRELWEICKNLCLCCHSWKLETTMHKLLILPAAIHTIKRRIMYPAVFKDASNFSQFRPDPHIFVVGFIWSLGASKALSLCITPTYTYTMWSSWVWWAKEWKSNLEGAAAFYRMEMHSTTALITLV